MQLKCSYFECAFRIFMCSGLHAAHGCCIGQSRQRRCPSLRRLTEQLSSRPTCSRLPCFFNLSHPPSPSPSTTFFPQKLNFISSEKKYLVFPTVQPSHPSLGLLVLKSLSSFPVTARQYSSLASSHSLTSNNLAWVHAQSLRVCLTLCDPVDCSPPGSSVLGFSRILEWVAMPFSRGSSQPRDRIQVACLAADFFSIELPGKPKWKSLSNVWLFVTPWTAAHQAPLSM